MGFNDVYGDPKTFPTLEELATSPADLWRCPRCGCRDWDVGDSRFDGVKRKRQRLCRNCKTPLRTHELPVPPGYRLAIVVDPDHSSDTE